MKKAFTILSITFLSLIALYAYLTWESNGNPRFMHHRYNKLITRPLASMGITDAQFKMGLFWFYGSGTEPNREELENAVYWWEKASAKGNQKASTELANAKGLLEDKDKPKDTQGYAYWQAVEYGNRAIYCIDENNDAGALDYTMKALVTLERLDMQADSLYLFCLSLIPQIEEIAKNNTTN